MLWDSGSGFRFRFRFWMPVAVPVLVPVLGSGSGSGCGFRLRFWVPVPFPFPVRFRFWVPGSGFPVLGSGWVLGFRFWVPVVGSGYSACGWYPKSIKNKAGLPRFLFFFALSPDGSGIEFVTFLFLFLSDFTSTWLVLAWMDG